MQQSKNTDAGFYQYLQGILLKRIHKNLVARFLLLVLMTLLMLVADVSESATTIYVFLISFLLIFHFMTPVEDFRRYDDDLMKSLPLSQKERIYEPYLSRLIVTVAVSALFFGFVALRLYISGGHQILSGKFVLGFYTLILFVDGITLPVVFHNKDSYATMSNVLKLMVFPLILLMNRYSQSPWLRFFEQIQESSIYYYLLALAGSIMLYIYSIKISQQIMTTKEMYGK